MNRGKKPRTSSASVNERIDMDLNDVIRKNVLRHLPAKSLRRCSNVCREWRLHISSPFFAHSQSNCFHDVSGFFCHSRSSLPSFISLDPMIYGVPDPSLKFLPEPVDIRSSCKGLVCCQGRTDFKPYYICNPVTQQWKKLPQPYTNHGNDPAIVLVFEPSLMNFVAEYDLICAFRCGGDGYGFEIYSSTEGSWRTCDVICSRSRDITTAGVYVNGSVYWRAENMVIGFNTMIEKASLFISRPHGCLGNVNGKLCIAFIIRGPFLVVEERSAACPKPWQFYSPVIGWLMTRVSLEDPVFAEKTDDRRVLCICDETVVIRWGRSLISYSMKNKSFKRLASDDDYDAMAMMVPYVNSLVEVV